jgi:hypothetical protein
MTPNPSIMQAVEKLGYRVTVGDVSTQAGLNISEASLGLLALASDAGGHLQVAESVAVTRMVEKGLGRSFLPNSHFLWRFLNCFHRPDYRCHLHDHHSYQLRQ